jgi:hypothetical protein
MNKMISIAKTTMAPALLLAASAASMSLPAQDNLKAYVSFGQNIALNHSLTMAGAPWTGPGCYTAEFGIEFYHPASTLLVRPNAGYTRSMSDPYKPKLGEWGQVIERAPTVYDVMAVFVGFDLVYNVSKKLPITATVGPSFHSWNGVQSNNVETAAYFGEKYMGENRLKLGWRMGLGYGFKDNKFRVDFTYTMTEWKSEKGDVRNGKELGWTWNGDEWFSAPINMPNPSRPSYFTLKASYTF